MIEATLYKALGDPVRLEMVKRLSLTPTLTLGALSTNLGISRQGARKQIEVLANAQIIHLLTEGRETFVSLDIERLILARNFITQLEQQWDHRLQALKKFAETNA